MERILEGAVEVQRDGDKIKIRMAKPVVSGSYFLAISGAETNSMATPMYTMLPGQSSGVVIESNNILVPHPSGFEDPLSLGSEVSIPVPKGKVTLTLRPGRISDLVGCVVEQGGSITKLEL